MQERDKDLVRRYFDEVYTGSRYDAVDEIVARDYVEHALAPFGQAEPGRVDGPQAVRESAAWLKEQFPDMTMTIEAMVAEGDLIAVRVVSEGTNLGKLNGVIPPTGRHFVARQSHWFRVRDGKLCEHWATREDLPTMLQLGVIQPPGRQSA
jgi:predicted ester cyclase